MAEAPKEESKPKLSFANNDIVVNTAVELLPAAAESSAVAAVVEDDDEEEEEEDEEEDDERLVIGSDIKLSAIDINDLSKPKIDINTLPPLEFEILT